MSENDRPRRPQVATVEEWDEGIDEALPDTRMSANVAAKRSKPELVNKASYERRRDTGTDSGYASRAPTVESDTASRKDRRLSDLKIDTTLRQRESRPYQYSPSKPEAARPSSRPPMERSQSRSIRPETFYRHHQGECWICDKYGKHIDPPKGTPVPPSPLLTHPTPPLLPPSQLQPLPQPLREDPATPVYSQPPPRTRRSSSNRSTRPVSMYADMTPEIVYSSRTLHSPFVIESPAYSQSSWQPAMTVQYAPVTYAQYPSVPTTQMLPLAEHEPSYFASQPLPRTRPAAPSRRTSVYDQRDRPVVEQSPSSAAARPQERYESFYDQRPPSKPQKSSRDKDYDRQVMPPPPPPQQIVLAHRPHMKKAATSASTATLSRQMPYYENERGETLTMDSNRGRRGGAELPPVSRRPSVSAATRSPNKRMSSYDKSSHVVDVASTTKTHPLSRRMTDTSMERYEAEVEAYQRTRGASDSHNLSSQSLTAEALRKVPKAVPLSSRSETNSSQKSRNSSSKGSASAKTNQGASNGNADITLRVNGIALGIPADSNQRVTIMHKGMNISVAGKGRSSEKEYTMPRTEGAPSINSRNSDAIHRRSESISRYSSRDDRDESFY